MPEDHNFKIDVYPSPDDPNNWEWEVTWTRNGTEHDHTGPAVWENVLSTKGAAKQAAEAYVRTMGRNLARAETYRYAPEAAPSV